MQSDQLHATWINNYSNLDTDFYYIVNQIWNGL